MNVDVIIPALNEQAAIGRVIHEIPRWIRDIVVVDNGSTDRTAQIGREANARVLREPRRGYGYACLTGISALRAPDVVVFLDGDYSDYPEEMGQLVEPIESGRADLVIGSRLAKRLPPGAMLPHAWLGNVLLSRWVRMATGCAVTDIGPIRAITYDCLLALDMCEGTFGWTLEMMLKAPPARVPDAPGAGQLSPAPGALKSERVGHGKLQGERGDAGHGREIRSAVERVLPQRRSTWVQWVSYLGLAYAAFGFYNQTYLGWIPSIWFSTYSDRIAIVVFGIARVLTEREPYTRKRIAVLTTLVTVLWLVLPVYFGIDDFNHHLFGTAWFFIYLVIIFLVGRRADCSWNCPCAGIYVLGFCW
jgi:hypothetical protein